MKASEFIKKIVKEEFHEKAVVLALIPSGSFFHVMLDEELPKDHRIVIGTNEPIKE